MMNKKPADFALLASHLRLAANAVHVQTVELVAVGRSVNLGPLADRLQRAITPEESSRVPEGHEVRPLLVRPLSMQAVASANGQAGPTGVVLVAPSKLKKSELGAVADLLGITGWPVVGVITYRPEHLWQRAFRRRQVAAVAAPNRSDDSDTAHTEFTEVVALAGTLDRPIRHEA